MIIKLDIPTPDAIYGELCGYDEDLLTDDMLMIEYDSYGIDTSWYPEHDESGQYVITVFKNKNWHDKVKVIETANPLEAKTIIEEWCRKLNKIRSWNSDKDSRRCELIDKGIDASLTEEEKAELDDLQQQMLEYRHTLAPLPVAEIKELLESLRQQMGPQKQPATPRQIEAQVKRTRQDLEEEE